jgi:hypothetical protein
MSDYHLRLKGEAMGFWVESLAVASQPLQPD